MLKILPNLHLCFKGTVREDLTYKYGLLFLYNNNYIQIIGNKGTVCNYNGLCDFDGRSLRYGLTGCWTGEYNDYVARIMKVPDLL